MQNNSLTAGQYLTVAYPYKLDSSVREEICVNHKQVLGTKCILVFIYMKMLAFLVSEDVLDAQASDMIT